MVLGPFAPQQRLRPLGRAKQNLGCRAETRHLSYSQIISSSWNVLGMMVLVAPNQSTVNGNAYNKKFKVKEGREI